MWNKINHGGEPTKNIDRKYAIFVGRYQPYHFGHIDNCIQIFLVTFLITGYTLVLGMIYLIISSNGDLKQTME